MTKDKIFKGIMILALCLLVKTVFDMHTNISLTLKFQYHSIAMGIVSGPVDVENRSKWKALGEKEKKQQLYELSARKSSLSAGNILLVSGVLFYSKYEIDELWDFLADLAHAKEKDVDKYYYKLRQVAAVVKKHNNWEHLKDVSASREELKKILKEFRK